MSVKSLSSSISGHEVLTTAAHPPLNSLKKMPRKNTREMVGGCCVCSDERGWDENPLVYCDGQGCNVAVHQGRHKAALALLAVQSRAVKINMLFLDCQF